MGALDDIIAGVTGRSNAPRQRSGALRAFAKSQAEQPVKPSVLGGGGGVGGSRSFSAPTQNNNTSDRSGRDGGGSFDAPKREKNFFENMFTVPDTMTEKDKDDFKLVSDQTAATVSGDRNVGDRLPEMWDNTFLEDLARPFIPFGDANENDAVALDRVQQSQQSFKDQYVGGDVEFRHLSQEEWDALDLKTQQAITANYALYQAAQADKALEPGEREEGYDELVSSVFGEDGGSETYAPNTIRVLAELGYTNDQNDLDNFLSGGATLLEQDLLGTSTNDARSRVLQDLQGSTAWQNSNLVPMLEEGTSFIESLRQGDALSADTLRLAGISPLAMYDIDPARTDALSGLMQGMASRDLWAAFETDPEAAASFRADFDSITTGMDPALVSRFFRESYPQYFQNAAFGDSNSYMTPEEFNAAWLS